MDEKVLVYLGAVIDTDGSVGWRRMTQGERRYIYPQMSVTNQNIEILSVFLRYLQFGSFSLCRMGVKGPIWQWHSTDQKKTIDTLHLIRPYSTKAQRFLAELDEIGYSV